ncbi:MAG: GAF domain-containing protein, partial [Oxalobacter sp.]|nr:GAF domain-containing protein [Oxalobacter sp.]
MPIPLPDNRSSDILLIRNYCSHAISRSGDEGELFANICAIIVRHSRIRMACTGFANPSENLIRFDNKSGEEIDFPEKMSLSTTAGHPDAESVAVKAFSTGKAFWNRDFGSDPVSAWWPENASNEISLRSLAALPLHENGKTIGVFLLASAEPDAFDPALRGLLAEIADDMDFAVANFRREQIRMNAERELRRLYVESRVTESEIRRLNQLYTTMGYCNQAIARCKTQDELFGEICRIAVQYDTIDIAWIGVMDRAQHLIPVAMEGASPEIIAKIGEMMTTHIIRQAVRDDRPVWIQDCAGDPACDCDAIMPRWQCLAGEQPICAIACLPLHKNGEIAGMLVLHAFKAGAFDIVVQKLLKELTAGIDFALANFRREHIRSKAEHELRRLYVESRVTESEIHRLNQLYTTLGYCN